MTVATKRMVALPCGHAKAKAIEGPRHCATCKRTYVLRLVPAEHASQMTGRDEFRIEWESNG